MEEDTFFCATVTRVAAEGVDSTYNAANASQGIYLLITLYMAFLSDRHDLFHKKTQMQIWMA